MLQVFASTQMYGNVCTADIETVTVASTADGSDEVSDIDDDDSDVENDSASVNSVTVQR